MYAFSWDRFFENIWAFKCIEAWFKAWSFSITLWVFFLIWACWNEKEAYRSCIFSHTNCLRDNDLALLSRLWFESVVERQQILPPNSKADLGTLKARPCFNETFFPRILVKPSNIVPQVLHLHFTLSPL